MSAAGREVSLVWHILTLAHVSPGLATVLFIVISTSVGPAAGAGVLPAGMRGGGARAQAANLQGETIYKGHRSYDLMLSLQLGMRHSAGDPAAPGSAQRLVPEHFVEKARLIWRGPRAGDSAMRSVFGRSTLATPPPGLRLH